MFLLLLEVLDIVLYFVSMKFDNRFIENSVKCLRMSGLFC